VSSSRRRPSAPLSSYWECSLQGVPPLSPPAVNASCSILTAPSLTSILMTLISIWMAAVWLGRVWPSSPSLMNLAFSMLSLPSILSSPPMNANATHLAMTISSSIANTLFSPPFSLSFPLSPNPMNRGLRRTRKEGSSRRLMGTSPLCLAPSPPAISLIPPHPPLLILYSMLTPLFPMDISSNRGCCPM